MEIWKDITDYPGYQVSNLGRVKSLRRKNAVIKRQDNRKQYRQVTLRKNGKMHERSVHRLVAEAFIPNPENKPCVNHINGIKTDNRVENLEWVTYSENSQHALSIGLKKAGQDNYNATITNKTAFWCRSVYKPHDKNFGASALAKKLNVDLNVIRAVVHGESYKSAGGTFHKKQHRSPVVQLDVREEIRSVYVKGSREFGTHALSRKYNLSRKTVSNIVKEV